jgi:predicted RNA methylase
MSAMVIPGLEEAVERVAFDRLKLSQWHTPDPLAQKIVRWSGAARLKRICEPCAGGGAFLRALESERFRGVVDAIEIDPTWARRISTLIPLPFTQNIINADFLTRPAPEERYCANIQNPPYEDGQDGLFLEKAMNESERVIALIRTVALCGANRLERVWGRCNPGGDFIMRKLAHLGSRPDFGGKHGASVDFSVVFMARRGVDEESPIEWWSQ